MSALANFTTAPTFTSGLAAILPIIPQHQHHFRYGYNNMDADADDASLLRGPAPRAPSLPVPLGRQQQHQQQHERQRVSRLLFLREERDKRRRSVNIPAYHKPKEARLVSAFRHRCVEVQRNGSVRTTQLNSLFAVFEVTFWCHVLPFFKSCSSGLQKASLGNTTFSTVLLRYKESNRYLCVDKRGKVYSLPVPIAMNNNVNLEECVFQSAYLLNQYDVYYSRHYPTHTDKCRAGLTPGGGGGAQKREKKICRNRWYLGVDRRGRVRTVKTGETKMKPNTFFITRWVNEQKGQFLPSYHHSGGISPRFPSSSSPSAGTVATPSEGLFEVRPPRKPKSVFSILFGHKQNVYRHQTADEETEAEHANRKSQCANLLKNCNPEVDSRRANHASSLRRRPTPQRETRREEIADISQR